MRLALILPALVAFLAMPALAQQRGAAQNPQRLGDFQDWTAAVHTEGGQKVCYAFTRATRSDPERQGVIMTVTHRQQGRDQVAMSAGYAYPRNASVTVAVGSTQLAFYTSGNSAFARDGRAAVAAFRAGATATARGPRAGGRGSPPTASAFRASPRRMRRSRRECPARR